MNNTRDHASVKTPLAFANRSGSLRVSRIRVVAASVAAALVVGLLGASFPAHAEGGRQDGVFIMGIDGMDPTILSRLIAEGKMPNFEKLAAEGSYQSLATSNPPQSPVAWSNFVTGMSPGGPALSAETEPDSASNGSRASSLFICSPRAARGGR